MIEIAQIHEPEGRTGLSEADLIDRLLAMALSNCAKPRKWKAKSIELVAQRVRDYFPEET